ncbi:LysR family transcriptional regulator [Pseudorhodoplanes sp.]|uniref:LysR family transcriptional regulator n=1 Tax=Pseudorhodoplanes sp. TaxID=1934341 RepID=UPI003D0C4CB5
MDIGRLDLNLLLLLERLYRLGSLSEAASALGMRQPTASNKLAELRRYFGDELFVRTGHGMRPTSFMDGIIPTLQEALRLLEIGVLSKPAFVPQDCKRTFVIATTDIGVFVSGPPLIHMLRSRAPHAGLRYVPVVPNRLESMLEDGSVDLAIGSFPDLIGPSILRQGLFEHPFVCIVRRDHPFIGDILSLQQFLDAEHVVVSQESQSLDLLERHLAMLGYKRRIPLHLPHYMTVPQVIASSDMIGVVPLSLAAWFVETSNIKLVRPPIDFPLTEAKQFWHRRTNDDPAISWLRQLVAEQLMRRDPTEAASQQYACARAPSTDLTTADSRISAISAV